MPITVKELLLSDVISEVVEKVNFNFDQLVLAGGGPPGIQGIQGLAGPIGPLGPRGDHWFVGPTAFGQTADHDGTSLQIQDLFLDSNGDVYKYFQISGTTGWTYSGINLKGPSGDQGSTGGALEWSIYPGGTSNAIGNVSYTPRSSSGTPTANTDFLIPNILKDSIFLGNPQWAYTKLDKFAANILLPASQVGATGRIPKLSIIQSQVNSFGMNGLLFGAQGATTTVLSSGIYGTAGSPTSAFDFVNMGFATESFSSGETTLHRTRFKLISPRASVKFEIGGNTTQSNQAEKRIARFETVANETSFRDWTSTKTISIEDNQSAETPIIANLREISIISKPSLYSKSSGGIYSNIIAPGTTNQYGYVALQNDAGNTPTTAGWPEHSYGNVIIGPVKSGTNNLGYISPQGLAIVRQITKHDTVDAAIRFFQTTYLAGATTEESKIKSTFGGAITPVRIFDSFLSSTLDTLAISSGLGTSVPGVNAAGRIGFTNNVLSAFKPQHAFHVSISKDAGTRNVGWDTGGAFSLGELDMFYTGFDNDPIPGSTGARNSGIGFASKSYRDIAGVTHSVPIIQTYYRLKTGSTASTDNLFGPTYGYGGTSIGQGTYAPHLYIQPHDSSNIGIGFSPKPSTLGASGQLGYWPLAKVAINGGVVIGSTAQGYHSIQADRQEYGLQLQSRIVVGTTSRNIAFSTTAASIQQILETGGTGPSGAYGIGIDNISASFNQFVFGRFFLSHKSGENPGFPEFGFSDFRTGIRMGMDNLSSPSNNRAAIGKGQLVSAPGNTLFNNINNPGAINPGGQNGYPKVVATWSSRGDILRTGVSVPLPKAPSTPLSTYIVPPVDYSGDFSYSNLKIQDTFSESIQYVDFSTMEKKYASFKVNARYNISPSQETDRLLKYAGVYYVIPTNKSMCQLNLEWVYQGANFDFVDPTGDIRRRPQTPFQGKYFLDGSSSLSEDDLASRDLIKELSIGVDNPVQNTFINDLTGNLLKNAIEFNRRWPSNFAILEDGHYNGQRFTLHVVNVSAQNNLYLESCPPPLIDWPSVGNVISMDSAPLYQRNDRRLKVKTKIIFPTASDSGYMSPGTTWGDWYGDEDGFPINRFGAAMTPEEAKRIPTNSSIEQSSILGNKLGAVLQSQTVYNFVWTVGDWGIYNNMGFDEYKSYNYVGAPTLTFYNQMPQGTPTVNGFNEIGDSRIYEYSGAWVCTGQQKLIRRNMFDYGCAYPLRLIGDEK